MFSEVLKFIYLLIAREKEKYMWDFLPEMQKSQGYIWVMSLLSWRVEGPTFFPLPRMWSWVLYSLSVNPISQGQSHGWYMILPEGWILGQETSKRPHFPISSRSIVSKSGLVILWLETENPTTFLSANALNALPYGVGWGIMTRLSSALFTLLTKLLSREQQQLQFFFPFQENLETIYIKRKISLEFPVN